MQQHRYAHPYNFAGCASYDASRRDRRVAGPNKNVNPSQLHQVHALVAGFLRAQPASLAARSAIETLAHAIGAQVEGLDEFERHVAAALCALGPAKPPPPLSVYAEFAALVEREFEARPDRALEAAVAYGCGIWRTLEPERGPWFDEWGNAVVALARALEPAVREVVRWLSERLPGLPPVQHWSQEDGRALVKRDAALLAVELIRPLAPLHAAREDEFIDIACAEDGTAVTGSAGALAKFLAPGSKAVLANAQADAWLRSQERAVELPAATVVCVLATDERARIQLPRPLAEVTVKVDEHATLAPATGVELWSCACGNRNCPARHRLHAWQPAEVDLWSFVASAVKGPERTIKAGALVAGMYFPLLGHHGLDDFGRLRLVPVEYKFCRTPACRAAERKYEGDRCPACHAHFDPATTLRQAVQRIVLVRDVALHERVARFACGRDNNLYEGAACPLCAAVAKVRRPTWVWVRTGNRELSLDDDESLVAEIAALEHERDGADDARQGDHAFI